MKSGFLDDFDRPLLFAHRGRSAKAPENTMAAFTLAWESGIPGIELDVRLCTTGELVVFHDAETKRITGTPGTIEQSSLAELRDLDAGAWFSEEYSGQRIPTLDEVFDAAPVGTYFDIEIKVCGHNSRAVATELARAIHRFSMANRCIISSFYPSAVWASKSACPGIPTALIYSDALKTEHPIQHIAARVLSNTPILKPQWQTAIETLERRGRRSERRTAKPVIPWTVNVNSIATRCLELGAEGVISEDPVAVMESRSEEET